MPTRLQRHRHWPWQTTPKAVYVGRPSRWGSPYKVGVDGTAEECVAKFRAFYTDDPTYRAAVRSCLGPVRTKLLPTAM
jgi:hypothetical protein